MNDITMCRGTSWPFKLKCLRFVKREVLYQPYYLTAPYDKEKNECKYFKKISKK